MSRRVSPLFVLMIVGCARPAGIGEGLEELGTFEGFVDPASGEVHLGFHDAAGNLVEAPGRLEQAVTLAPVTEDKNGTRGTATAADTAEFAVECNGVGACIAPSTAPVAVAGGCGAGVDSFDLDVTVRAFFPTGVSAAHVEFLTITNLDVPSANNTICNSDVASPNINVGGAALNTSLGMFRYGLLLPSPGAPGSAVAGAADTVRWKFRNPGGRFKFTGRIVGRRCASAGECGSATIATDFWTAESADANQSVLAAAEGNGVVYVAGGFTYVGPRTGSLALLNDAAAGSPGSPRLPSAAVEPGNVNAAVADGSGGVFIGGTFTSVGGTARSFVAHILSNGSLDSAFVPPAITGTAVRALALVDGKLFVGGIIALASPARANVLALSAATGSIDAWVADANGEVRALVGAAGSPGTLYLGGAFTTVGGAAANGIAATDTATGAAFTWTQPIANSSVFTLALSGNTLYLGGIFTTMNGSTRNRLAALNATTGALLAWAPAATSAVNAVAVNGANVVIGGAFTNLVGASRSRFGVVDGVTGALQAPNPGATTGTVDALAVDAASNIYVGGQFTAFGGDTARARLAVVNAAGTLLPFAAAVGPNNTTNTTKNSVAAIAVAGGVAFVGGSFDSAGGVNRNGAAAYSLTSGQAGAWNPNLGATGIGRALAVRGSRVYIGGTFTTVGGAAISDVVAVDATTGVVDGAWTATITRAGTEVGVHAIAVDAAGRVYLGGAFSNINGSARGGLGVTDATGAVVGAWVADINAAANEVVRSVAVLADGNVAVGGDFASLLGATNLGVLTPAPAAASLAQNLTTNGRVSCVDPGRDFFVAGGSFTTIAGLSRTNLAVVTTAGVRAFSTAPNGAISACDVAGNNIHVGGAFTSFGAGLGAKRYGVLGMRGTGTLSFGASVNNNSVTSVAVAGELTTIGGSFVDSPVTSSSAVRTGTATVLAD